MGMADSLRIRSSIGSELRTVEPRPLGCVFYEGGTERIKNARSAVEKERARSESRRNDSAMTKEGKEKREASGEVAKVTVNAVTMLDKTGKGPVAASLFDEVIDRYNTLYGEFDDTNLAVERAHEEQAAADLDKAQKHLDMMQRERDNLKLDSVCDTEKGWIIP